MRYPNAVARFLLNMSLFAQWSLTILSVLISLLLVISTSWVNHNTIIFMLPVVLSAWIFRRGGLFFCLGILLAISWISYAISVGTILPSSNGTISFLTNACALLLIGLLVCSQRDTLDFADASQEDLEYVYEEQHQLNQIKDQFLQNVNHELRTPLTAIYGYLELLLEHNEQLDNEMRITFLQHAMQSCDELQLLVNNVLDTMGIEKEKRTLYREQLPVRDILFEVLERFDPKSVQEHRIYVEIPDYIVVLANAQYLRQVLRNLLSNAFKYAPVGTPITVSASLEGMVVHPLHASPEIRISVQDVGPGIPDNEMPLLFGQFVRLRRDTSGRVRGSGLGLFLSKQFVEAMDGHIWAESEGIEGKGSRFCFTLPCIIHPKVTPQTLLDDFAQFRSPLPIN